MKRVFLAALAVLLAWPVSAQDDGCDVIGDHKVCAMPEPYICDSISKYQSPGHFAESHGGYVEKFDQVGQGFYLLSVIVGEPPKYERFVFLVNVVMNEICLTAKGTPILEPAGVAL